MREQHTMPKDVAAALKNAVSIWVRNIRPHVNRFSMYFHAAVHILKTHPDLYSALCQDMERDLSCVRQFC